MHKKSVTESHYLIMVLCKCTQGNIESNLTLETSNFRFVFLCVMKKYYFMTTIKLAEQNASD
jgi:hypothetical protein